MIGIAGAGAFGTALAVALAKGGREVRLWARDAEQVRQLRETARIVWMRRDVTLTQAIVARRRALADAIAEALGEG